MNKKILTVIIIVVVAAVVIPIGIYTISPLFINNTVNEPLPTTAAIVNKNSASQEYQKFISMNEQDRSILSMEERSPGGDVIIVESEPEPISVSSLLIVIRS